MPLAEENPLDEYASAISQRLTQASSTVAEQVVGHVEGGQVELRDSFARRVESAAVYMDEAAAGYVRASAVEARQSAFGVAAANSIHTETLDAGLVAAGAVTAQTIQTGILLAFTVRGDVRPLLTLRVGLAIGAGFAGVLILVRGIRQIVQGRKQPPVR